MSTELREEFTKFLQTQRYAESTMDAYLCAVYGLAAYSMKPPDRLTDEEIQDYLHHLIEERKLAWSSCNVVFSALQCFYGKFLKRDENAFSIPPRKRTRKLPLIMSRDEVLEFLDSISNLKHRVLLQTIYSAGLRVSEVVRLQPRHIESDPGRMMIRIEEGKGRKDRYSILSPKLLDLFRDYYRIYRPGEWLFFGRDREQPLPVPTAQRIYYNAKKKPV